MLASKAPGGSVRNQSGDVVTKSSVEIGETSVFKYRDAEGSRHEVIASEHGRRIGSETGLFGVPRILSHDTSSGVIEFERIANELHVRRALCEGRLPEGTMKALGACLAAIHRSTPPESVCDVAPALFASGQETKPAFLHGDFQIENILYESKGNTLFVVDWSAPAWLGGQGNRGPAWIDLGTFIISLFVRRPFEKDRIHLPGEHADQFLTGYRQGSGEETEIMNLKRCFPALLDAYTNKHGPKERLRILVRKASLSMARRYVLDCC